MIYDCIICGQDAPHELEGHPICFDCYCDIQDGTISNISERVDAFQGEQEPPKMEEVLKAVAIAFNVSEEMILKRTRKREIVEARQACMVISAERNIGSDRLIAEFFGRQNHSQVNWSKSSVANLCQTDPVFRSKYEKIQL